MMRIGVLASGGGTNLQSIIDACRDGKLNGEVNLVISNNSAAGALERARKACIRTIHLSGKTHPEISALDDAILGALTGSVARNMVPNAKLPSTRCQCQDSAA